MKNLKSKIEEVLEGYISKISQNRILGKCHRILLNTTLSLLLFLPLFISLFINYYLTVLKETPLFWLNVGGYPIWLRHFVDIFYYPYLVTNLILVILFSIIVVLMLLKLKQAVKPLVACLSLSWLFYGLILFQMTANNLDNVAKGNPVHWHPSKDYIVMRK